MPARYVLDTLPIGNGKQIKFFSNGNPIDVVPVKSDLVYPRGETFEVYIPNSTPAPTTVSIGYTQSTSALTVTVDGVPATLTFPDASAVSRGLVNTVAQAFAGDKIFNANVSVLGNTTLGNAATDITSVNGDLIANNRFRTANTLQIATSPANSTTNLVAASSVDIYSYIQINQTNAGATFVIPNPTGPTRGIHLWISNTGTQAFVIDGHIINPQTTIHFIFDGAGWSETEVSRHDSFVVVTATGTIPNTVDTVIINNAATAITLTMPVKIAGKVVTLMRGIGSTGGITVNPGGGQIEALANTLGATTTLAASGAYGQNVTFITDGTNWLRKNNG